MLLAATRLAEAASELPANSERSLGWALRQAFFADARNIGEQAVLRDCLGEQGLDVATVERYIDDGRAYAALCTDMRKARDANIRVCPTLDFNEGRQRLTGNVGYRIIEANVRELLEKPDDQSSWC